VEDDVPRILEELGRTGSMGSATTDRRETKQATYVAIVHTADGVRFQAAATSRRELVQRIAEYVQRWGGYVLRPDHARHLRSLLLRGESEAAVELYFAVVGKRWDKEWLITTVVAADAKHSVAAELGEVAKLDGLGTARDGDAHRDSEVPSRAYSGRHERAG
jgi:hypothetical protein